MIARSNPVTVTSHDYEQEFTCHNRNCFGTCHYRKDGIRFP
ncbi:hypothetical protein CEV32_0022 [Brucella rhizosphaerae]|uniref:Uncharacterized protein n=1 Tax=Brucella rhizosphaerae TaxID=571254 RepID=A0A256FGZ0_9HYPH|nr:hypothetical protein CEV32_0022 [Brucella rhizosphaerae]